jgi:hypothetical protein
MTDDHHGRTARRATLLVRAVDEVLGTHRTSQHTQCQVLPARFIMSQHATAGTRLTAITAAKRRRREGHSACPSMTDGLPLLVSVSLDLNGRAVRPCPPGYRGGEGERAAR